MRRDGQTPAGHHWFEGMADHMGAAYLRYSFTLGTEQEVDALIELLGLEPGCRILDVGCGPGRHSLSFARRGFEVVGVDISETFVALAAASAAEEDLDNVTFLLADARNLRFDAEFDAAISLCQGAFGLSGGPSGKPDDLPPLTARELDEPILGGIEKALVPGGVAAVSAFSAYFQLHYLEPSDTFDVETGVNHEETVVRNPQGQEVSASLWTTCFTPRELRLLARTVGFATEAVYGVSPGQYRPERPQLDHHEFLLIARRLGSPRC